MGYRLDSNFNTSKEITVLSPGTGGWVDGTVVINGHLDGLVGEVRRVMDVEEEGLVERRVEVFVHGFSALDLTVDFDLDVRTGRSLAVLWHEINSVLHFNRQLHLGKLDFVSAAPLFLVLLCFLGFWLRFSLPRDYSESVKTVKSLVYGLERMRENERERLQ